MAHNEDEAPSLHAMSSTLKLQNGDVIRTDESPQTLAARFDACRRDGTLIKVDVEDGATWVNPHVLATITQNEPYEGLARVL